MNANHYQSWCWEYLTVKIWSLQRGHPEYLLSTNLHHDRNMYNPEPYQIEEKNTEEFPKL